MKYLNVAEKNKTAKAIARILDKDGYETRESSSPYNKIYEFSATISGKCVEMVMTSTTGHFMELKFVDKPRLIDCFSAEVTKDCTPNKDHNHSQTIKKTLEHLITACDGLIIWTDCDREGENIGFDIINLCKKVKSNIIVHRARFTEITEVAINTALENLGQPDENVSNAADVRAELDFKIGNAFTQLQTLKLKEAFPEELENKSSINFGRRQMPVLGFIVGRYHEIENFESKRFWTIRMNHVINGIRTEYKWSRGNMPNQNICKAILDLCQEKRIATVTKVDRKSLVDQRPLPLTTAELLITVSRELGISAMDTMEVSQILYSNGYISYPRTGTNIFSNELNLTPFIEQQCRDRQWGAFAQQIVNRGGPKPRRGENSDQAHPPIYPLRHAVDLYGNEKKIYEYIVRHFLACVSADAVGYETTIHVDISGEKFTTKGALFSERNYLDIYKYRKVNCQDLYSYEEGDVFVSTELELVEEETKPPGLLREADILTLIVKQGMGSKSTLVNHLQSIRSLGYVSSNYVPEPLGLGLIEGYNQIQLEVPLTKPQLQFEEDLKLISEGRKDVDEVKREKIAKFENAFKTVEENFETIIHCIRKRLAEQPQSNGSAANEDMRKPIFECPKCGKDMILRNRKNGNGMFIGCSGFPQCENPMWLPEWIDNIEVLDEKCSTCKPGFKILKVTFIHSPFADGLNPRNVCIGGCDSEILKTFRIEPPVFNKPENVKNGNYMESLEHFSISQNCLCDLPAILGTTKKDGKNRGRNFYKCPKIENRCKFFMWEDQIIRNDTESCSRNGNLNGNVESSIVMNKRKAENEEDLLTLHQKQIRNE